mgnify:CR=1 FL=1
MSLVGQTLRVISECEPLEIGEMVYCMEDCPTRKIIRVWTRRLVFGVNEVVFSYERRGGFKIT